MSAFAYDMFRRITPAPIVPAIKPPITKPTTATVSSPPEDCRLERYRFCARPVFALRNVRIEKRTTRDRIGRIEIDSQKPGSAGVGRGGTMVVVKKEGRGIALRF